MYPQEINLTPAEEEIVFRIRQLIGDDKNTFIDDVPDTGATSRVKMSGLTYELEEPKGYPLEVYVDGTEYTSTSGALGLQVLSYKILRFTATSGVLGLGNSLLVVYNNFRHSDLEIINTYDTSAKTYLVAQCNLSDEELGVDLLVLATAYILLSKDLRGYIENSVRMRDSDSEFDASARPGALRGLLSDIQKTLKDALERKMSCKMLSLPVYKIE